MEMWGRWCQFDDDSAFGLAISNKGGLCRVFSPAAPIFVVQGTVVGTARQNISMVGCSCHHYAPVNSLRASGVHRMLTLKMHFDAFPCGGKDHLFTLQRYGIERD